MLSLERVPVGPIGTICYLVSNEAGQTVIIDPGAEPDKIIKRLRDKQRTPVAILLTHGHYDHIEAVSAIKALFLVPVTGSHDDAFLLEGTRQSLYVGHPVEPVVLDEVIVDGQTLSLLGQEWTVIATPGHTPGSVTYVTGSWAFTGDTLFSDGSVGRTDLWGGSTESLKTSIIEKLFLLPASTEVYPGHGNHSTIGQEKAIHQRYNVFEGL
jgi:glyoxylase-like metal-dependent hydrolase (beta-lactamase superfamily II)